MAGPFSIGEAALALGTTHESSARLLGYLARRGWLTRVKRGLYLTVPLDARRSGEWVEDPWVVASRVFAPCYIGGWSAAEYWDLTEQLFRTTLVVSAAKIRRSASELQGMRFEVRMRPRAMLFGTRPAWRGSSRVEVSDPSRTIIDVMDDPKLGGGIRHCADVLREYLRSEHRDDAALVAYGDRVGNRTVYKRLGYLLETREVDQDVANLINQSRTRISAGYATLDPSNASRGRIVRRWGLRVNVQLNSGGVDD